jgi:hypothetical protein
MGKGGGTQTVVNTQDVPGFIQDQIKQTFGEVERFRPSANIVPNIAGFTPTQTQSFDAIRNITNNNPLANLASSTISDIIKGDFTISDPLQTAIDAQTDRAINDISSLYSKGGRLGSDAFGTAIGEGVTQASAPLLADAIEKDQARKLAAVSSIPSVLNNDLALARALGAVGAEERALDQAMLDRPAMVTSAQNTANQQRINNLLSALGSRGQVGGTSTSQQPGRSPLAGGLGGALTGATLGSAFPASLAPSLGALAPLGLGGAGALIGGGLGLLGLI